MALMNVQTLIIRTEEDIRLIAEQVVALYMQRTGQRIALAQGVYVP
jgi:hypothetical protein